MITFTQGGQLRFVDPPHVRRDVRRRTPSWSSRGSRAGRPRPRPGGDRHVWWRLRPTLLRATQMKLKTFLMDPSDPRRHRQRSTPTRSSSRPACATTACADSLSTQEIRRLYRSVVETLHDAIKHRGSTAGRRAVRRPRGKPGELPGCTTRSTTARSEPCCRLPRATIRKAKFGGRSTYYLRAAARSDRRAPGGRVRPGTERRPSRAPRVDLIGVAVCS